MQDDSTLTVTSSRIEDCSNLHSWEMCIRDSGGSCNLVYRVPIPLDNHGLIVSQERPE